MQPTPVRKYRVPAYPTRLEVLEQPELLEKHLPPGWRTTAEMAGLAAMFLALNGALKAEEPKQPATPQAAIVAPIFEHGEGRGAVGCVVVTPPPFLSEEDALEVIVQELSDVGVLVTKRNAILPTVTIPLRHEVAARRDGKLAREVREIAGKVRALNVDALDEKHNVAVEFVSESDYFKVGGVLTNSTVQEYAFKEVAGYLAQQVGKKAEGLRFGVFYDPLHWPDIRDDHAMYPGEKWLLLQEAKEESKRLLRLQVKDFIDWLKGQGVI
jgi:hypothetical protein